MKGLVPAIIGAILFAITGVFATMRGLTEMPELGGPVPKELTKLPPRLWNFNTEAIDQTIADLKKSREKIETDQKSVVLVKAQLDSEKAELEKLRTEVEGMRKEIETRVLEIQENEMVNLKTLAQTYSAMAPTAAVTIFRAMDENQVVKIMACMKVDKTGPILGEMSKVQEKAGEEPMAVRAARITDKLRLIKPIKKQPAA